jgi:hypothetical protein
LLISAILFLPDFAKQIASIVKVPPLGGGMVPGWLAKPTALLGNFVGTTYPSLMKARCPFLC